MFTWGILPVAITVRSLHSNTDGVSRERAKWGVNSCYFCVKAGATESTSWSKKRKEKARGVPFPPHRPSERWTSEADLQVGSSAVSLISPLSVSVLQMDPVQKAVLHHTLGIPPTAKRRHVSCSVCQLRFNSQVSKFSFGRGGKSSEVTTILPETSRKVIPLGQDIYFRLKHLILRFCTGICGPQRLNPQLNVTVNW